MVKTHGIKFHLSGALVTDVTWLLQSLFFSRVSIGARTVTVNQFCYNKVIPKGSLLSFLGSLPLELWGWWRLSGRQKRWCHVRSDFLGLHLKIICCRVNSSPCPLHIQICHFSRGLGGPIAPLPHRKRQNSRKMVQVNCPTRQHYAS